MADFKIKDGEKLRTTFATIASATVVAAGRFVEIDSGIIVDGTATGAKLAWAPSGSADGETQIEITVGNDFTLVGTGDAVFAVTQKGTLVDLVMSGTDQQIDVGTSSTDVLQISASSDAGVAGSASNIEVRINKPIH